MCPSLTERLGIAFGLVSACSRRLGNARRAASPCRSRFRGPAQPPRGRRPRRPPTPPPAATGAAATRAGSPEAPADGGACSACRFIRARSSSRPTTPAAGSATTFSAQRRRLSIWSAYYRTVLKHKGELVLRRAGDPRIRRRQVPRGDDGVSARRDDQGLTSRTSRRAIRIPKPGGQPARFPTLIQIVPVVAR